MEKRFYFGEPSCEFFRILAKMIITHMGRNIYARSLRAQILWPVYVYAWIFETSKIINICIFHFQKTLVRSNQEIFLKLKNSNFF